MFTTVDVKARAQATYSAAADFFDDPRLGFWEHFGSRTVDRLGLRGGECVLDVCCGTGASALVAAERVGPTGRVIGVDFAAPLLTLARRKADARGFHHVTFEEADVESYSPNDQFDAVVCVFGMTMFPEPGAVLRRLWDWVRPGGSVAITTWGPEVLEPGTAEFWEALRDVRPDLHRTMPLWTRLSSVEELVSLYHEGGMPDAAATIERWAMPIESADDFWPIMLGSGFRGTIDQMTSESRERVRERVLRALRTRDVRWLDSSVVYGWARKPGATV